MKVLFLDIDGVLNSTRSVLSRGLRQHDGKQNTFEMRLRSSYADSDGLLPYSVQETLDTIDPVAVAMLNRLLSKDDVKLVLSTSHRNTFQSTGDIGENPLHAYRSGEHIAALDLYMKALGIEKDVHDATPVLYTKRGVEVQAWIDEQEEVTHYAILDDGKDFFPDQNLIWCNPSIGFSAQNYYDACKKLVIRESTIIF